MVIVITSGGFDPIHDGHIEYLQKAKMLCDNVYHVCIANSDKFLIAKKGYCFYTLKQRKAILQALECVDEVVDCIDDDSTVCKTIESLYYKFKNLLQSKDFKMIFAKGGDRFECDIPEKVICDKLGIQIVDGLGEKISSSSELVENAKNCKRRDLCVSK